MTRPIPSTTAGRRLFSDVEPMDMWESNGVTPGDIVAVEQEAGELDAAWSEAEAALPEGWVLRLVSKGQGVVTAVARYAYSLRHYRATVGRARSVPFEMVFHDDPAAALQALAAKLREKK